MGRELVALCFLVRLTYVWQDLWEEHPGALACSSPELLHQSRQKLGIAFCVSDYASSLFSGPDCSVFGVTFDRGNPSSPHFRRCQVVSSASADGKESLERDANPRYLGCWGVAAHYHPAGRARALHG